MTTNPLDTLRQRFPAEFDQPPTFDAVEDFARDLRADLALAEAALEALRANEIDRLEARLAQLRSASRPAPKVERPKTERKPVVTPRLPLDGDTSGRAFSERTRALLAQMRDDSRAALLALDANLDLGSGRPYLRVQDNHNKVVVRLRLCKRIEDLATITPEEIRQIANALAERHAARLTEQAGEPTPTNGHREESLPK